MVACLAGPCRADEPAAAGSDEGGAAASANAGVAAKSARAQVRRKSDEEARLTIDYPADYPFPLVMVRFPTDMSSSFIDEIGALKTLQGHKRPVLEQLVNEQMVKSTYFACQLYRYLQDRLPPGSVVLMPCKLQTDDLGNVASRPFNKPIAPVVTVDLYCGISIGRVASPQTNLGQPDTFGDRSRTHVSMYMPVSGKRHLFAGRAVVEPSTGHYGQNIETFYNAECRGEKLKAAKTVGALVPTNSPQYAPGTFVVLKSDFRYAAKNVAAEAAGTAAPGEPAAIKQLRYYGNIIVDALNSQDLEQLRPALLAESVGDIAPDLADRLCGAGDMSDDEVARRVGFFNHCLVPMRERLFARASASVASTIYDGDFGRQYRTAVNSEMEYVKKIVAAQWREAFGTALAVASTAIAVAGPAVTDLPVGTFFSAVAVAATTMVSMESDLQRQLHDEFIKVWNASNEVEVSCLMTLDKETIQVRGAGAEGFRANMKEGYESRFARSVTGKVL